ncbi:MULTISPECIES: restriction endonuclease [unclassified Streptomyces]|uniref:restriction endonuclease n=1 Tax=unclassified Streptomyces TaxID=2593676 RepID=UPI002349C118|nr:restriction endonuclease [Streptomyces sp. M92]WCN05561.1 restriction endonuclease [Streptomyces sp. M92]
MTAPARHPRRRRSGRRFDLRATALFFGLAAVGLCVAGWAARMAFGVAERRPAWALVLVLGGVLAWLLGRRRRSGLSASGLARRTTRALAAGTETALEALEETRETAVPREASHVPEPATTTAADDQPLTADEFEQAIAELCLRDGCAEVEVVGGAGDLGADVTAVAPDGRRLVVQCKCYADGNKVGSEDLQRFGGTCFTVHDADVAVVVTTSDFTRPAVEYAEQCGIVCVDERGLRDWRQGAGPAPWALAPARPSGFPAARWQPVPHGQNSADRHRHDQHL